LLDLKNFHWLANNASICNPSEKTSKLLAILVSTARDHFGERKTIRETWGSVSSYLDWSVRIIFLLGKETPIQKDTKMGNEIKSKIDSEIENYGDLVMGNFLDSYRNLSYKHIMGYKWILKYCENADYVWKVDDDIFFDTLGVIDWRAKELENGGNAKLIDLYCPIVAGAKPQRNSSLKWSVSKDVWPFETYPIYCSGIAYGISVEWIRKIYSVSANTTKKVFWIDDLYVTGILVHLIHKKTNELPVMKFIWPYVTFDYNPYNTTFCDDGIDGRRNFGVIVRMLRGNHFGKEVKCLWKRALAFSEDTVFNSNNKININSH